MNNQLSSIEQEIYSKINDLSKQLYSEDQFNICWTKKIKRELKKLGEQYKHIVWGDGDKSEWLWDLCWVDYGKDWTDFKGVNLACEIEWKGDDYSLMEDFLKLTVAIAELRLFICTIPIDVQKQDEKFEKLKSLCPENMEFNYLVIGIPYRQPKHDLPFRSWII